MDSRLDRLQSYLGQDPDNPRLLVDAAREALGSGDITTARDLAARLAALDPGNPEALSLSGETAMRARNFAEAADIFAVLMRHADTAAVRFNRAYSLAMTGRKAEAATLLDDDIAETLPQAATLRLQLQHERGEFEAAAAGARALLDTHERDPGFSAAVSVLALDVEDIELARRCAALAGSHPDAVATRGLLALHDADPEAAIGQFDEAIATRPHHPRAWIGRGLAHLARQDNERAAADLERGASQFGDHLGSWIAAGWAYFAAKQPANARACFERAIALDDNFAETHGSLAVLDILSGDRASGRRRTAIAMRLDRHCQSALLAQTMLMEDDPERAQAMIVKAMNSPIDASGQTIASYMSALARRSGG